MPNLLPYNGSRIVTGADAEWVIPFTMPSSTDLTKYKQTTGNTGQTRTLGVRFTGASGIYQNTLLGDSGDGNEPSDGPSSNICGSLTYRDMMNQRQVAGFDPIYGTFPYFYDDAGEFLYRERIEVREGMNTNYSEMIAAGFDDMSLYQLSTGEFGPVYPYDFFGIWQVTTLPHLTSDGGDVAYVNPLGEVYDNPLYGTLKKAEQNGSIGGKEVTSFSGTFSEFLDEANARIVSTVAELVYRFADEDDPPDGVYDVYKKVSEGPGYRKEFGSVLKTIPITSAWLNSIVSKWVALSFAQKETTPVRHANTSNNYFFGSVGNLDDCAALTDSETGYYAGASGITAYGGVDLSEDVINSAGKIRRHGYKKPFNVVVPFETRKNFPFLVDTTKPPRIRDRATEVWTHPTSSGLEVFNTTTGEIRLSDNITENKFRDAFGTFKPGQDALEDVGWGVQLSDVVDYGEGVNAYSTSLQLQSGDGADYKLSLKMFYYDVEYNVEERQHANKKISLGEPLVIEALEEENEVGWKYDKYEITAISRRSARVGGPDSEPNDPYIDILDALLVVTEYARGGHLLEIFKTRAGSLWGFKPLLYDENNVLDRFSKKSLRLNGKIETESSGIPTSVPGEEFSGGPSSRGFSTDAMPQGSDYLLEYTEGVIPRGELPPLGGGGGRSILPDNPSVVPKSEGKGWFGDFFDYLDRNYNAPQVLPDFKRWGVPETPRRPRTMFKSLDDTRPAPKKLSNPAEEKFRNDFMRPQRELYGPPSNLAPPRELFGPPSNLAPLPPARPALPNEPPIFTPINQPPVLASRRLVGGLRA